VLEQDRGRSGRWRRDGAFAVREGHWLVGLCSIVGAAAAGRVWMLAAGAVCSSERSETTRRISRHCCISYSISQHSTHAHKTCARSSSREPCHQYRKGPSLRSQQQQLIWVRSCLFASTADDLGACELKFATTAILKTDIKNQQHKRNHQTRGRRAGRQRD
jgi:hypothetical protein